MEFRNEYQTFVSLEKYETIKNHTVGQGDIIFSSFISDSIRSAILPVYIEKAINKADCFLVRVSSLKINRNYLVYYFSTKAMRNQLVNQIHGATRPRINTTQLKAFLIPLPPLQEQQLIVTELESRLTVCDKIEETITLSLQQAETLKQSILKRAFEGKLVTVADSTEAVSV
jgi:type I restriction enzyme S subunit